MKSSKPPLLLIAEDDIDDLYFFENYFKIEFNEWKYISFKNGAELIDAIDIILLKENIPSFIVLDMNMPRLNGIETLEVIRLIPELNKTKILGYSSSNEKEMVNKFYQLGGTKFIQKPNSIEGYQAIMVVLKQM